MKPRFAKLFPAIIFLAVFAGCENSDKDTSTDTKDYTETASDLNLEMIHIPNGTYQMGSPETDTDAYEDEFPLHSVGLDAFYIGKYETTQAQWEKIMGSNPSQFPDCGNCPVENVSYDDVMAFIEELNTQSGKTYRLPTEAEWEYACRAGTLTEYHFGDSEENMGVHAWTLENAGGRPHPVGEKSANHWGLFDMYGNVEEWCQDWYGENYYELSPSDNPLNTDDSSELKVVRGGSFEDNGWLCRSAYRMWEDQDYRFDALGFRLVCGTDWDSKP